MLEYIHELKKKAHWVRKETLLLHQREPGTRLASSLSCVELFVKLYYGGFLKYGNLGDDSRDRIFVSKGHGSICLYPILADLGFFDPEELLKIGLPGSFLGTIPDVGIPGYESINGSLGLGLGVGCGTAIGLKLRKRENNVFVVCGDGELNEGSIWEAVMFAAKHSLDNLILIVDNNKLSMLDYQDNIMGLSPLSEKFKVFGWETSEANGHDFESLNEAFNSVSGNSNGKPKVIIADTVKGKGVPELENDILCHVRSLTPEKIDQLLERDDF
jgi:transketolase